MSDAIGILSIFGVVILLVMWLWVILNKPENYRPYEDDSPVGPKEEKE